MGFKRYAHRQTEFNAAMSYTIKHAILGEYPEYTIDYASLLVSRGNLTGANMPRANASTGRVIIGWEDNTGIGEARGSDKSLAVILNPAKGEATYVTDGEVRSMGEIEIQVSPFWAGDEVEVYIGFISENGKNVANSAYVGTVEVV